MYVLIIAKNKQTTKDTILLTQHNKTETVRGIKHKRNTLLSLRIKI